MNDKYTNSYLIIISTDNSSIKVSCGDTFNRKSTINNSFVQAHTRTHVAEAHCAEGIESESESSTSNRDKGEYIPCNQKLRLIDLFNMNRMKTKLVSSSR